MGKRFFLTLTMALACKLVAAQFNKLDSLQAAYKKNREDSTLVLVLIDKGLQYRGINPDSGMICLKKSMALARRINYQRGVTSSLQIISLYHWDAGDLAGSMKMAFELLPKARAINDQASVWGTYSLLGLDYEVLQDYKKAIANTYKAESIAQQYHLYYQASISYYNLCSFYIEQQSPDSATYFHRKLTELKIYTGQSDIPYIESRLALLKGDYAGAINAGKKCIQLAPVEKTTMYPVHYILTLQRPGKNYPGPDSGLFYAKRSYAYAIEGKRPVPLIRSAGFLATITQKLADYKNAFYYQQVMLKAQDNLYNQRKALQVQSVTEDEAQRKRLAEAAEETYRDNVRLFSLLAALGVVIVVAFILLFNNRQRKKANILLGEQKQEIQHTLNTLRSTQAQLIQSEKMASLGELTAGIAHEIQNPLNFVNNFSEVSVELLAELKEEEAKGNKEDVRAIADDLTQNLEKIHHHGKRADAIVKGMLQHSQSGSGAKEPTNINSLAHEYLRLSYHGLRSKDKSFNAEMVTRFDEKLPQINVIPQDIGRVMLNLFNNAFYAVNKKQKTEGADYKAEVSVSTSLENGQVIIKVKDNGIGIPDAIKDKIMQPFFTTKPTGEGTGLGLSLTYDMVVKGHAGKIEVNTKEGEFTEFIVSLPLN